MNAQDSRSQTQEGQAAEPQGGSDVGAFIRRTPSDAPRRPVPDLNGRTDAHPPAGRASGWMPAGRRPAPIVDTPEARSARQSTPQAAPQRPASSIVDTTAASRTRTDDGPGRKSDAIVDTADRIRNPFQRRAAAARGPAAAPSPQSAADIVGNTESLPAARDTTPAMAKFAGVETYRATGREGPSDDRVRAVRAARKQKLVDRARSLGRDPGANSVEGAGGKTRSEKTHKGYLERGQQLLRRYRKQAGLSTSNISTIDPVHFVNWLFSIKPTITSDAWRPYRQSAKAILATIPHDDTEKAISMIDSDIIEAAETSSKMPPDFAELSRDGSRKRPRKTSALKEKRFPKRDFDQVISYLKYFSKSKYAEILVDWMVAGVATGLRPVEWQATDLEIKDDPSSPFGRHVWLYVMNAKATNGRGNGAHRTVDISGCQDETIEAVKRMCETGMQWLVEGDYDTKKSRCSQLLYTVCGKLFKKRQRVYALYSLRHQFVANAKNYHDPASISAMCGHIVTDTAISSYGKKRSGWDPEEILDRAAPVAEEIATVRQQHKFFEDRITLLKAAGLLSPSMMPDDEEE